MSISHLSSQDDFSLDQGEINDLVDGTRAKEKVSSTKDMTPTPGVGVDAYGVTSVLNGASDDTAIVNAMTAEQQEFSTRLLQLCGDHPIGQAIVTKLRDDAAVSEDPWLLAEQALKILYAKNEDCIPHVQPYFYDSKVIENLFYGDKGLFLRFLGRGGFGSAVLVRNTDAEGKPRNEVWKIAHKPGHYDGKTQRWHSVHTDPTNQIFIARLNREADATAHLGKKGISPEILERGTIRGADGQEHPYFSTKFVPGMTVKQLITAKRTTEIPSQLTADVGVLFGVQFSKAHKENFTHRDASKANLYIADDGRPIILDWGLSYHNRDGAMTQMGAIMGTPEIMAPEVAMGGTVNASRESDVYSLAAVLYEMQTGKHLFTGEDGREVIVKHAKAARDLEPLKDAKTPKAMIDILSAALDIDIAKRPDAEKLARQLWPYSSLYLAHGKMSFDEFLKKFDTLGRLQLPSVTEDEKGSVPSKFVAIDHTKQVKGRDDLDAESAAVGATVNALLIRKSTELVRGETRKKIATWIAGLSATAALTIGIAAFKSDSVDAERNKDKVTDVIPDPNAPIKEIFDCIQIERTPDGGRVSVKLFDGLPCELTLTEQEVVALWDEAGTHAIVWRPNGEQSMKLLGYADPNDFPTHDELPEMPKKGMEGDCVSFIDPNTGQSMTYISSIQTYIVIDEDGFGSVYSHRLDIRDALGPNFTYREREIVEDPVARKVLLSFPLALRACVNPDLPAPGGHGKYTRAYAAGIPANLAKQLIAQFPDTTNTLETAQRK